MSNFIVGKHYIEILTVLQTESKNIGQLAESEKKDYTGANLLFV